jgi:hypothetical protein
MLALVVGLVETPSHRAATPPEAPDHKVVVEQVLVPL